MEQCLPTPSCVRSRLRADGELDLGIVVAASCGRRAVASVLGRKRPHRPAVGLGARDDARRRPCRLDALMEAFHTPVPRDPAQPDGAGKPHPKAPLDVSRNVRAEPRGAFSEIGREAFLRAAHARTDAPCAACRAFARRLNVLEAPRLSQQLIGVTDAALGRRVRLIREPRCLCVGWRGEEERKERR